MSLALVIVNLTLVLVSVTLVVVRSALVLVSLTLVVVRLTSVVVSLRVLRGTTLLPHLHTQTMHCGVNREFGIMQ